MTPSTRNLDAMPEIADLERGMLVLAALERMLFRPNGRPDRDFIPEWSNHASCRIGIHDDGQGDHFYAVFDRVGCFIKGFAHESELSPWRTDPPEPWPGLLDDVPREFRPYLAERMLEIDCSTFVMWRFHPEPRWSTSSVVDVDLSWDGSDDLLDLCNPDPERYADWAEEQFEVEVDRSTMARVLALEPATEQLCLRLGSPFPFDSLRPRLVRIGYPV